ncbi:shufflon system plasmid conjugative transfer pilus tip adhesin PilV [Cetobacterium sp.]|uniref:shufflon system plasmid conjugative transfer pilus tip adhesin PilV n=1 Tax=Cetobacterium sp. TaxID=2071632 RepID=UPI003F2F4025
MEINNLKVNEMDPFFTAEKWNESVSFIKTFQGLIYSILGHKFKGVYDPTLNYNIHDYIWFNGKCYIIKGINSSISLNTFNIPNQNSAYFTNNSYLTINENKLYNISGNTKTKISDLEISDFEYIDNKNFVVAKTGTKLAKVFMDGTYEIINAEFEKDIKSFCIDDFALFCITNNEILFSELESEEETIYKNILTVNDSLLDIATYNRFIVALTRNKIIVLNKADLSDRIFEIELVKPEKAKITSSSQNEFYIFDGESKIISIFIDDSTVKISNILQHQAFNNIKSLKATEQNVTITTNEYISSFVASKYILHEIDPRMLIVSKSILPITNSTFAVDFSKGELGSEFNKIYPNGYTNIGTEITNGTYQNASINVTFDKDNFLTVKPGTTLKYRLPNFGDTLLIFEMERTNRGNNNPTIFISNGTGKKFSVTVGKDLNENTPYKIFVPIKDNIAKKMEFRNSVLINEADVTSVNEVGEAYIEFKVASNEIFRIKQVIQVSYQEMENIDYLSNCNLIFKTPNDSLCYSTVAHDSNGIPTIKTHANLLKEKTGLRVNNSDNYNLNNVDVMLNTAGSKKIGDELTRLRNDLNRIEGIANHSHPYMRDGGRYGTIYLSNWIRTTGATGWHSETYGGGIYMSDWTWLRVYGNKKFYVSNGDADAINTSGGVSASRLTLSGWSITVV